MGTPSCSGDTRKSLVPYSDIYPLYPRGPGASGAPPRLSPVGSDGACQVCRAVGQMLGLSAVPRAGADPVTKLSAGCGEGQKVSLPLLPPAFP